MKNPISFLALLYDEIQNEQEERAKRSKEYTYRHNPSSASYRYSGGRVVGACLRSLFYKATKVKESNPADFTSLLQMGFGDAIHVWMLGKLGKSKAISITTESAGKVFVDPLTKEVSFRLDGLVNANDGTKGWLEIKTKQSFAVQRMFKEAVSADNLCQGISYFGCNPDLSWGNFVTVGRDNALRLEHQITKVGDSYFSQSVLPEGPVVPVQELSFAGIKRRWAELEGYLSSGEAPPRDYKVVFNDDGKIVDKRQKKCVEYKSDWRCLYCAYKDHCWSQEDAMLGAYKIG